MNVIVVDRNDIGQKASGNTTAKITFEHNLIYNYLINTYGMEYAVKYFKANKQAINNIKKYLTLQDLSL